MERVCCVEEHPKFVLDGSCLSLDIVLCGTRCIMHDLDTCRILHCVNALSLTTFSNVTAVVPVVYHTITRNTLFKQKKNCKRLLKILLERESRWMIGYLSFVKEIKLLDVTTTYFSSEIDSMGGGSKQHEFNVKWSEFIFSCSPMRISFVNFWTKRSFFISPCAIGIRSVGEMKSLPRLF